MPKGKQGFQKGHKGFLSKCDYKKIAQKTSTALKGKYLAEQHSNWKGGRKIESNGYVAVYCPTHPHAINGRYVHEHRLIMEKHIGRTLLPNEVVHHINGNKEDNRIENLMLFSSDSEHKKHHWKIGTYKKIS